MSNKKSNEKNVRKLTKIGKRSIGLTLPIDFVRELSWRERQKVKVTKVRGGLQIKDWRK